MDKYSFEQQAEFCRGQALAFLGKPESLVLLRIAREFDRLATGKLELDLPARTTDPQRQPERQD